MTPGWIVAELRRRDPLLTTVGWLMIGGLAGVVIGVVGWSLTLALSGFGRYR